MSKNQRVAIYARISVKTDESTSVTRQLEQGQAWATMNGSEVVATFTDDGVSGAVAPGARPGLSAALAAAAAGEFDVLVVAKLDRLARDVRSFLTLAEDLSTHSVSLVSIAESLDLGTAAGRMVATVLSAFAAMERERTAERVLESNRYLASVGAVGGARAPYGWQKVRGDDQRLRLTLDPATAPLLRSMVDLVLAGDTVAEARRASGVELTAQAAMNALRHPVLLGRHEYKGAVVTGPDGLPIVPHEALLDWEEWSDLQAKLDAGAVAKVGTGRGGTDTLLGGTGLAVCGVCAAGLVVNRRKDGDKVRTIYKCRNGCVTATAVGVDEAIESEFLAAVGRFEVVTVTDVPSENAGLLAQARERQAELSALVAEGLLPLDVARENLSALAATIDRLEAEGTEGETTTTSTGTTFSEAWTDADTLARRDLLASGVAAVVISKVSTPGSKTFDPSRVSLDWNVAG
jgi:site-specific DNA recombinase